MSGNAEKAYAFRDMSMRLQVRNKAECGGPMSPRAWCPMVRNVASIL